jgi:hypothetical protein
MLKGENESENEKMKAKEREKIPRLAQTWADMQRSKLNLEV